MKTIMEMAREAWAEAGEGWVVGAWFDDRAKAFEAFAAMVRADAIAEEREAVLDLVNGYAKNNTDLRDAIRARGQA